MTEYVIDHVVHAEGRRSETTAPLLRFTLMLAGLLAAPGGLAQEAEPTQPYRFFGGDVDRTEKNAAVEACEYRILVEEQRCNEALNKSTCIARVHEKCLADPDGQFDGGRAESSGQPRR